MTTDERTQTSIDTFITPATEAGCITLRPFSAGIRAREVMRRMEREPDVAAAKRACAPKPPMTPEAFRHAPALVAQGPSAHAAPCRRRSQRARRGRR